MSAALLAASGGACDSSHEGVNPPANQVFYPSALITDRTGRWLYAINGNPDFTYNSGTITAVDLSAAAEDRQRSWPVCPGPTTLPDEPSSNHRNCCLDPVDRVALICDDRGYIDGSRTVRIGSFGAAVVANQNRDRLFVAVRGDPSITVVDVDDDGRLDCGGRESEMPICDDIHRVAHTDPAHPDSDEDQMLPGEPYALALDDVLGLLYVGHLTGGNVSLLDTCTAAGEMPRLLDIFNDVLAPAAQSGITSLTLAAPGDPDGLVYAGSRFLPNATTFRPVGASPCAERGAGSFDRIALVSTTRMLYTGLSQGDVRGVAFSGDGQRAFVLQRSLVSGSTSYGAPVLSIVDITPDSLGRPRSTVVKTVEVCTGASRLAVHDPLGGGAVSERIYVTCFEAGQIYVIDPYGGALVDVVSAGRGPADLVFSPIESERGLGYIAGFGSNNVSVLDLRPGSPTQHLVIQRIGVPSATPRKL